jgi:hypothetical protein
MALELTPVGALSDAVGAGTYHLHRFDICIRPPRPSQTGYTLAQRPAVDRALLRSVALRPED